MKLQELERKIRNFSFDSEYNVEKDTNIHDILDSLAFVELVMDLESDLDIELLDDDLENINTVKELLELINNNIDI